MSKQGKVIAFPETVNASQPAVALWKQETSGPSLRMTSDQVQALERLDAWARWSSRAEPFGLFGAAGTGKTTVMGEWSRSLDRGVKVCFLAPTHKAAGVLSSKVYPHEAMTLHRALGCRRRIDEVTGEMSFLPAPTLEQMLRKQDFVVLDECSMLGAREWRWLLSSQRVHGFGLVVMGDANQLPPVDPSQHRAIVSPTFAACTRPHRVELQQVVRHDGALLEMVHRLRGSMGTGQLLLADDLIDDTGLVKTWWDSAEFFDAFLAQVDAGARLVAWTNKVVDWTNKHVRERKFGKLANEDFVPGERLVVRDTYKDPLGTMWHAEDTFVLGKVREVKHPRYPVRVTRLTSTNGHSLLTLASHQKPVWQRFGSELRARCEQRDRMGDHTRWRLSVARVRPGWATTVHKSQGSTWPSVYVVQPDLLKCPDPMTRERLLYVAYSRAARELHVRV